MKHPILESKILKNLLHGFQRDFIASKSQIPLLIAIHPALFSKAEHTSLKCIQIEIVFDMGFSYGAIFV